MNLSPHFTLEELISSATAARLGIDNTPTPELIEHMGEHLVPGLEEVRKLLGQPMHITSGYRCAQLNAETPGSSRIITAHTWRGGGFHRSNIRPAVRDL